MRAPSETGWAEATAQFAAEAERAAEALNEFRRALRAAGFPIREDYRTRKQWRRALALHRKRK